MSDKHRVCSLHTAVRARKEADTHPGQLVPVTALLLTPRTSRGLAERRRRVPTRQ